MQWRYLKVTAGNIFWGTNKLTKADLGAVKTGTYETIIDLKNLTYFDADANEWKVIEGDA